MKVLAIIPARGNSKGIKMKNVQKLAGKPLIEYTISSAKKSRYINRIIVSTDNSRIANISLKAAAEVPFLRPRKFSHDRSPTIDTIKHTLRYLITNESYTPDMIVILQPTSPLRTPEMIDKSINMLMKTNATSVITVEKIKSHPYISFWYVKEYLKPYLKKFQKFSRRQMFPPLYIPTGAVYAFWNNTIKKYDSIYGPKIKPVIINDNDANMDIDSTFDLFVCEMIISQWKKYKKRFL